MTPAAQWILHLTVPTRQRAAFLTFDVDAMVPAVAEAVSFTDLGGEVMEMAVFGASREGLGAWVAAAARAGRLTAAGASDRALVVDAARPGGPAERAEYEGALIALTARALVVLRHHDFAVVPRAVAAAEVRAVHQDRGDPRASLAWHVRFLAAMTGHAPPTPPPSHAVEATARLAHGQWLRLSGGSADHDAEIEVLSR